LGQNALASGLRSTAVGEGARATGRESTATGANSLASGFSSTATGFAAQATGDFTSAYGQNSRATALGSSAMGDAARATGVNSTALGRSSVATAPNSVALGGGSIADQPNTVSVGNPGAERRITNVAPGISGTDAVNANQFNNLDQRLSTAIGLNQAEARRFRDESRRGIAAVAALPSPHMPFAPGRTSWVVNGAATSGAGGFGAAIAHRLDTAIPTMLTAGVAAGFGGSSGRGSNTTVVGKIGIAGEF